MALQGLDTRNVAQGRRTAIHERQCQEVINDRGPGWVDFYAFLASDNVAQAGEWAYQVARVYAERYNPAHGPGLLVESVPFLADIVRFWKEDSGDQIPETRREVSDAR